MTPFYSAKRETDSRIVVLSRENLGSENLGSIINKLRQK